MQTNQSRRRWYQVSIRTLFAIVAVVAVYLAFCVNAANKQRRAVEVIGKDGHVVYYHEFPYPYGSTGAVNYQAEPSGPKWLRKIVGDDYFRTVRLVSFTPDESSLAELRNLPKVDFVAVCAYQLKDDDLKHLSGLGNIRELVIERGYGLSDACLEHIKSIPNVDKLQIKDTPVTDDCVEYLKELTQLKLLSFNRTLVSHNAVSQLRAALPRATIESYETYEPASRSLAPLFSTNDVVTKTRRASGSN